MFELQCSGSFDEVDFVQMTWKNSVRMTEPLRIRGNQKGRPLRKLPRSATVCDPVDTHSPSFAALQQFLETDPQMAWATQGADIQHRWPNIPVAQRRMKLAKAWKLFDASQTASYHGGMMKVQRDCVDLPVAASSKWTSKDVSPAMHKARLDPKINETILLTGVPKAVVRKILRNGLDERFAGSNAGSMFGEGNYFAGDAGKCDQCKQSTSNPHHNLLFREMSERLRMDADVTPNPGWKVDDDLHNMLYPDAADFLRGGEVFYIFVCKVCLGHCMHTDTKEGKRTGTGDYVFATKRRRVLVTVPGSDTVQFHSLLADTPYFRYREFVNFNSQYTHLEYLVAYQRVGA